MDDTNDDSSVGEEGEAIVPLVSLLNNWNGFH